MLGIHDYWLFVATGILLNLTPGQDTFYILGRSVAQGTRAGIASAFGISVGSFVHTAMAAVGLSALPMQSQSSSSWVPLTSSTWACGCSPREPLLRDWRKRTSAVPRSRRFAMAC